MGFRREKIGIAFDVLEKLDIDLWIVAGQESATNTEPALDVLSDSEFIGLTALIFSKDRKARVVCTPIDVNGYKIDGSFDEVIPFAVRFQDTLAEVLKTLQPKRIALDFSEENPSADGLSVGMFRLLEEAFGLAGFDGEVLSADPVLEQPVNAPLREELHKDKYEIKDFSKIS